MDIDQVSHLKEMAGDIEGSCKDLQLCVQFLKDVAKIIESPDEDTVDLILARIKERSERIIEEVNLFRSLDLA